MQYLPPWDLITGKNTWEISKAWVPVSQRILLILLRGNKPGVDVMISSQQVALQAAQREGLVKQITSLWHLLHQGLAIRGHTEDGGNQPQLLKVWAEDSKPIKMWRNEEWYMSHDIINELLILMRKEVLKKSSGQYYVIITILVFYYSWRCYWIISNKEQMNILIRWANNEYTISKEPIVDHTLFLTMLKDVLTCCILPLANCCSYAHDGATNMQGVRNGVATQIQSEVLAVIPIHCLARCLQLYLQEAGRQCTPLRKSRTLELHVVR